MERFLGFGKVLLVLGVSLLYLVFLAPWNRGTLTITGTAKMDQAPQIATYMASVSVADDDKEVATNSVNTKMTEIVEALKSFGIDAADIQTSEASVYENAQPEILIYPPRDVKTKKWQASNSITVKLRDTSKASALTDLLNTSGATSVSGPNFAIDDTTSSDSELLTKAIEDARQKGQQMAKSSGRILGRVMTVTEGYSSTPYPLYSLEKAVDSRATGVPSPIEPGTETLMKSVTVVFELL